MRKDIYICDICRDGTKYVVIKGVDYSVVFTTDQEEGKAADPYISIKRLDLCADCRQKIIAGSMPFGSGAQGHNKYWFKNDRKTV